MHVYIIQKCVNVKKIATLKKNCNFYLIDNLKNMLVITLENPDFKSEKNTCLLK